MQIFNTGLFPGISIIWIRKIQVLYSPCNRHNHNNNIKSIFDFDVTGFKSPIILLITKLLLKCILPDARQLKP